MSIYINNKTKLIVQGATGSMGKTVIPLIQDYGTKITGGVSPDSSEEIQAGVPIFNSVSRLVDTHGGNASLLMVPPEHVMEAGFEAIDAGLSTIVILTEGVPIQDTIKLCEYASCNNSRIVGPNTAGIVSPGSGTASITIANRNLYMPGSVGVVTRSGTLSMEVSSILTQNNIGQSTVFSVGGDPYVGTTPAQAIKDFNKDSETDCIVYVGEVGTNFEQQAARVIEKTNKPVIATVAGTHVPQNKEMGHAGAISGDVNKLDILSNAGAITCKDIYKIPDQIAETPL